MYKPKLLKIINQLKNNITKTIKDHEATRLYVSTWVISCGLEFIENKANGDLFGYYPRRATYQYLYEDFKEHFDCVNISPEIKAETLEQLHTPENIKLVEELGAILTK